MVLLPIDERFAPPTCYEFDKGLIEGAFAEGGLRFLRWESSPKPSTPTFGRIPFMLVSEGN